MNGAARNPPGIDLSLTPLQLDLLSTALASSRSSAMPKSDLQSNALHREPNPTKPDVASGSKNSNQGQKSLDANLNMTDLYKSPMQESPSSAMLGSEEFESPLIDYDFDDGIYDWDNSAGLMIGSLPGAANEEEHDLHEKRKSIEDDDENTHKRREGEEKTAKKPGRKPMTGEPTTKRKAQNRAAQRAFRERKERHLKELESKVEDLEKASESTNHENGRLRAQVERLNAELKEYKKRLSLSGTGASRSPAAAAYQSRPSWNTNQNDFQFAFPKFGDLPGSNFMNNGSLAKVDSSPNHVENNSTSKGMPGVIRANTSGSASLISPTNANGSSNIGSSNYSGFQPSSNSQLSNYSVLNGPFSPSIFEAASRSNSSEYANYGNGTQVPKTDNINTIIRGSSISDVTSPSTSSASNHGLDSSCGTTPEPSADSPDGRKASESTLNTINEEMLGQGGVEAPSSILKSPLNGINGIDWLAQQNGGQFDPVLFGDYREPQEKFLNSYDGYFNDAFPFQDFGNPFNTDEMAASPIQKRDLIKEVELLQDGAQEDIVVPTAVPAAVENNNAELIIKCEKLWDRVAKSEKFANGEVEITDLCDQLKRKAKCTGNGPAIDPKDLDDILGPERTKQEDILNMFR